MELNRIYMLSPYIHVESFQDGALVLRLVDLHMLELNPTARDVLAHTDGHSTVSGIANRIAEMYQVSLETALQDVDELFQQLAGFGVVEWSAGTSLEKE